MADLTHISLKVSNSGIKQALDQWFEQIADMVGIQAPHKLALLGMVSSYELIADTPMFDQFIFRSWADRSIVNSPTDPGSPSVASRYSSSYKELLLQASASINAEIPADVLAQIDVKQQSISQYQGRIETELTRISDAWKKHAAEIGLTDAKTPEYIIAQIGFYQTEYSYSVVDGWRDTIGTILIEIDHLRAAHLPEEDRALLEAYQYTVRPEYKMARPKTADIEQKYHFDEVTLSDRNVYRAPAFDVGQDILPSIKLPLFLTRGIKKTVLLNASSSVTTTHESQWNGSLGGAFDFFKFDVGHDDYSRFTEVVSKIGKLEINFENIEEIFAIRGEWFSLGALTHKSAEKAMKKNRKGLQAPLTYLIQSVVVVRGTSLTLHFENNDDLDTFSRVSTGGGGSIFGIPIGVGGGDTSVAKMVDNNHTDSTITFADSPTQCRAVGFRVQQIVDLDGLGPKQILRPYEFESALQYVNAIKENTDSVPTFTLFEGLR